MAITDAKGHIFHKSEVETGTTKNGNPYSKMTLVIKMEKANIPYDKIALSVFGDRCNDVDRLKLGDYVDYSYSVSAREWQGKWFNDVSLYKISKIETSPAPASSPAPSVDPFELNDPKGDLPF